MTSTDHDARRRDCWPRVLCTLLLAACGWLAASGVAPAAERGADGNYDKRSSSHFVLFQDVDIDRSSGIRGSRAFEQQVLGVLEEAYDSLEHFLGLRPSRPIVVVVHDPGIFDQQFSGLFRFPAAGFYEGKIHVRGDTVVHGGLIRTLHHELVHAAFAAEAPTFPLPAWLNEGLSEWFEARATGKRHLSEGEYRYLAAMATEGSLFRLADMGARSLSQFGPNAAQLAYIQSYAFFEHLARRYGERKTRDFVREMMRIQDIERAFERVYRADLSQLEERFLSEISGG